MFYLIETPDQFAEIRDILTDKCYIDYVLGNDNTHPALAEVIAIYVSSLDRKGFMLALNHPECINLDKDEIWQWINSKSFLTKDSKAELNKLFTLLSNNPTIKVEIQGHTDSKGNNAYNKKLSQKRAEAVMNFLVKKGIKVSRIKAVGYGETKPIAKNTNADGSDNEEGRALNRRIELKILSKDGESKGNVNKIYVPDELKK